MENGEYMKRTIKDFDLNNKRVIIRVDFNVPINNFEITDDSRIQASLETITYAINQNAKIILMSHLGRVKTLEDKETKSLEIVAKRLSTLLNQEVKFVKETRGELLEKSISNLNPGEVLLMENTRFEDLNEKSESNCNMDLASYWASLGDIFINDAFGTIHRKHASNVGISSILPNGIGFLVEKEISNLSSLKDNPERPYLVILGGAKISDKIKLVENLVKKADHVLIGGAMAFTFLKSEGYSIGSSMVDDESLDFCANLLKEYENKIILPIDVICAKEATNDANVRICDINNIELDEMGLDIGPNTINIFKKYINESNSIFMNGTMGLSEIDKFKNGTIKIFEAIEGKNTIIGGGDTAGQVKNFGFENYKHISTGGGASLEFLQGNVLPGLEAINEL